jgi:putative membrane protein
MLHWGNKSGERSPEMIRDPGFIEHGGRMFHRPGLWWESLGIILPTLLLLILIGIMVWAVLRVSNRMPANAVPAAPDVALQEVRLRYARGEMNRDEFVQRLRDLGGRDLPPGDPAPPVAG